MAVSVYRCLAEGGEIDRDRLAELFAIEYRNDPCRGYGGMAHAILQAIGEGTPWQEAAGRAFSGTGSMGNGGAMRVAPLGAYFAGDTEELVRQARYSADVTHAHPEGQAGAVAIALAAAWAWNNRTARGSTDSRELIEFALAHTPDGDTRSRMRLALDVPLTREPPLAAEMLGNGIQVTAPDTVPFAIWCAARHSWNYEAALWATASGFGDVDTNCAIVGGIVSFSAGALSIPRPWLDARGQLPVSNSFSNHEY
jgi:ADP-ribosylglycohydrolase